MIKNILRVLIVAILLFSFSCKTIKKTTVVKPASNLEKIYDDLISGNPDFQTMEIKMALSFDDGKKNIDLKGTIKLAKDSIIWVSLSPGLGIEAARLKCTKDSVFIMDRINKTLRASDYKYINKNWNVDVDFGSLQSILTGRFFIYPTVDDPKEEFVSNFKVLSDSSVIKVYRKDIRNIENLLKIVPEQKKVTNFLINDGNALRSLSINYLFANSVGSYLWPSKIEIKSFGSQKLVNITLDYSRIQLNTNPSFPFSVPSSYSLLDK